jgi:hypothetical protein
MGLGFAYEKSPAPTKSSGAEKMPLSAMLAGHRKFGGGHGSASRQRYQDARGARLERYVEGYACVYNDAKDIAMSVVRLTLLNGDPLDLYDKPSAVYPLTEGERGAGGKSIVLVDGKEFRVLESIDSIKRRLETPTTANAAEVESSSSRRALARTT